MNFITKHPVKIIWIVSIICFVILSGTGYYWYNYQLEPNDRPSFVGGIFGSVLGLFGTFIVLWSTTLQTRSIQIEAAREMKEQRKREDELQRQQELAILSTHITGYVEMAIQYFANRQQIYFDRAHIHYLRMSMQIKNSKIDGWALTEKVLETNKKLFENKFPDGKSFNEATTEILVLYSDLVDKYKNQD